MSAPPVPDLARYLSTRFRGRVIVPGDGDYDLARTVFNAAIDRHPSVIARCQHADDVTVAVRAAAKFGLYPAIRGGGHSVAGWSTCDGLVIDLSAMKDIRVDERHMVASAEAGVTWGEFDRATAPFGLAVPGGVISTTGIAGLTLGGGVGWLIRKHGLTCDNLLSADVVTADGQSLRASATENADLFWALRGGGGNFGVVTRFHYRLHPVSTVTGGRVVFESEKGACLLTRYRAFTESLSEDCTASIGFGQLENGRPVISLVFCHLGSAEDAARVLLAIDDCGPPIENSVKPRPYVTMQRLLDGSFPPGRRNYWRSYYLDGLGDRAIGVLLDWSRRAPSRFSSVLLERYTGAASRVPSAGTAFPHRNEPYNVHILACWIEPSRDDENIAWADGFWHALEPYSHGAVYANFLGDEGQSRVRAAYGRNYERLVEVKRRYDPSNLFRRNTNVNPARRPVSTTSDRTAVRNGGERL